MLIIIFINKISSFFVRILISLLKTLVHHFLRLHHWPLVAHRQSYIYLLL